MHYRLFFVPVLFITMLVGKAQNYPSFGAEIPVVINGLGFDAMEPALSSDGNTIFFNSLNDGITTSLYYATRVNDSVFSYIGPLSGANQSGSPRLDGVASIDSINNFYWISTRQYPSQFDNVFHGTFNGSDVVNIGRVHGNFYVYVPGWLIMDASIDLSGNQLFYCNADFTSCGAVPCSSQMGIAQKLNDSTFATLVNSSSLLQLVNDTNYLVYAPSLSANGLELYYTRLLRTNLNQSDLCVSVRATVNDPFSAPFVIYSSTLIPEAIVPTRDLSRIYYHKKTATINKLFMRYRTAPLLLEGAEQHLIRVFPNPVEDFLIINTSQDIMQVDIYTSCGERLKLTNGASKIDVSELSPGIYYVRIAGKSSVSACKFIKQ